MSGRTSPPYLDPDSSTLPPPPPPRRSRATKHKPLPTGERTPWIPIAAASGACAAINGVFAKLTTTELTSSWASGISWFIGLPEPSKILEYLIRGLFLTLNFAFNGLMWALFTAALTRASSTTRVSIINTSANFMVTAFAGWLVFGEKLPGLWWIGACGLVIGNVIIGRRDEEGEEGKKGGEREGDNGEGVGLAESERYRDDPSEGQGAGESIELRADRGRERGSRSRERVVKK